jgi:translation initiation factor 3 subunit C
LKGRAKWLKKADNTAIADKKKAKQDAKKAKQSTRDNFSEEKFSARVVKPQVQSWKVDENMTEEILEKKVAELIASRGRKGTDPKTVLYQLEVLAKVARYFGPRKEIPVLMHLISSMFDVNRNLDDYMDLRTWRTCRQCLMRIVTILEQNKSLVLSVITAEDITDIVMSGKQQADFIKLDAASGTAADDPKAVNPNELKLAGSLENYLIRLEDEYTKSLQQINPHTQVCPLLPTLPCPYSSIVSGLCDSSL